MNVCPTDAICFRTKPLCLAFHKAKHPGDIALPSRTSIDEKYFHEPNKKTGLPASSPFFIQEKSTKSLMTKSHAF